MKNIKLTCKNCGEELEINLEACGDLLTLVRDKELKEQVQKIEADVNARFMAEKKLYAQTAVNEALEKKEAEHKKDIRELKQLYETKEEVHKQETEELNRRLSDLLEKNKKGNEVYLKLKQRCENAELITREAVNEATNKLNGVIVEQKLEYEKAISQKELEIQQEKTAIQQKLNEVLIQHEDAKKLLCDEYQEKVSKLNAELEECKRDRDYLQSFKSRLSTKRVGEELEQFCENEFNKIRTAFPHATFEKDTQVKGGSKGDYIYRESVPGYKCDLLSVMCEMKTETNSDSVKRKNEDFFAKLDKDRHTKNCEYAILVSTLEPDNDFYNVGIADVSYRYPKMLVVRPENFVSAILLLRQFATNAFEYRKEIEIYKNKHIDFSRFEQSLLEFKDDFGRNIKLAGDRFEDAIKNIDKSIDAMQKTKADLLLAKKHLVESNNKVEKVSVNGLTKDNPTVREMIRNKATSVSNDREEENQTAAQSEEWWMVEEEL